MITYPSRIPTTTATKEERKKKICCRSIFGRHWIPDPDPQHFINLKQEN
jgi:hypothetical protein